MSGFVLLLALTLISAASIPLEKCADQSSGGWIRTYGGPKHDGAKALIQTADGGYALAGTTLSFGAGREDAWLVKTDSLGNMQWNHTYGGPSYDYAYALIQTADGGYALAGYTEPFGNGNRDAWLVKTDSSGEMQWNKTYGGPTEDVALALVQSADGGYALAGYTERGVGDKDYWLVKTDSSGTMQWNHTYGGPSNDVAYDLIRASDGGYVLGGYTLSFVAGGEDFWLVKTDSSGTMQWNRAYGGPSYADAYALIQSADGGYALAGFTGSFGAGMLDAWLVKTDSSGNMQWNHTYGGPASDYAYALIQSADGGYALAGYTEPFGNGNWDAWLVKTDSSGTMQWNRTFGGEYWDYAYALIQTGDGGYALTGFTISYDYSADRLGDFWLIKTDSNGTIPEFSSLTLLAILISSSMLLIYRNRVRDRSKKIKREFAEP